MRATEEAAFWLYSAKAYALSMACELLLEEALQKRTATYY